MPVTPSADAPRLRSRAMSGQPSDGFRVFRVHRRDDAATDLTELETEPGWGGAASAVDADEPGMHLIVRPGTILHHDLGGEVHHAMSDPGLDDIDWLALVSDGFDVEGRWWDCGNYLDDPADPAPRPLRLVAAAEPALLLVDTVRMRTEDVEPAHAADHGSFVRSLATAPSPAYLTSRLRFSAADRQSLPIPDPAAAPSAVRRAHIPTVTIVVRTAGDRPHLLARALEAIDPVRAPGVEVIVVSNLPVGDTLQLLREIGWERTVTSVVSSAPSGLPGRTAAIVEAVDAAMTDYVWFVDDDDWVAPGAVETVVGAVHANDRPIVIGSVTAVEESWDDGDLVASTTVRTWVPGEWHRAFTGWNHLPNCAIVYPRQLAAARIGDIGLRHDLGEDYALQLGALTAPGATVVTTDRHLAFVSIRDEGTSVGMTDRVPWLRDTGSHISDLSRDPSASAISAWTLGRSVRQIPYPAPVDLRTEPNEPGSGDTADDRRNLWRFRRPRRA